MKRGGNRLCAILSLAVFCLAASLLNGHAAATPCQGQIGAETSIIGKTDYDPYSAVDLSDNYHISISNIGSEPCAFALIFRSHEAVPKLGNQVSYQLANAAHDALLTNAPAASAPTARSDGPVPPSQTAQIDYQLMIPRGQFAAPGQITDTVDLELYAVDESGGVISPPLQTTMLSIGYTVARAMSVNIKGGGTTTTMSFGALAEGQQQSVIIDARSNATYQLDVSSDNGGALILTPGIAGQDWSIPYAAMLDQQPLSLSQGASLQNLQPTQPGYDASHSLMVTIGDANRKRAGRYEDVITIEIRGAQF